MKNVVVIFICVVTIMSCKYNSKLPEEIMLFQKKPIMLTKQSELIIKGQNKVIKNEIQRGLKYVIYKDSLDCTSCAISKMHFWNDFIKYAEPYNRRLKFYFIYSPLKKDYKRVEFLLKNIDFDYPILLDTLDEFAKLNPHLPKNRALHAFLLDEDNNVILVGDPLYNKRIEKMFYNIVEEKLGKPKNTTTYNN